MLFPLLIGVCDSDKGDYWFDSTFTFDRKKLGMLLSLGSLRPIIVCVVLAF
jgi:hypothetical protein